MLQLTLKSDGTPDGTVVCDQDGRKVDGVVGFNYTLDLSGQPILTISLVNVSVNIDHDPIYFGYKEGLVEAERNIFVKESQ